MDMKLTNKEAIAELEELVIKQARIGFFDEEVEAMQHAIEVLKRFDGAVKLKNATTWMELPKHANEYHFYAIPREQEDE